MEQNDQQNNQQSQQELLQRALETLHQYVLGLSRKAEKTEEFGEDLWNRIKASNGVLQELAYFHDYGKFYGKYKVAGYTLTDILVWQVDHFKAFLDRHNEMNRYRTERLFLESLDILLKMEEDPAPYIAKMQGETGTDFAEKYS